MYALDNQGKYRITATIGHSKQPPDDILDAYICLAEHYADEIVHCGPGSHSLHSVFGYYAFEQDPAWLRTAVERSGAVRFLAPYL